MRRLPLAGLAALALLAGGLALRWTCTPPPTDEERIRALFSGAAQAVEEKRVGDAVALLSERFRGEQGWDRAEVKRAIAAAVFRGEWVAVSVAGDRIRVDPGGRRAVAVVHLVGARSGKGRALADLLPQDATALRIDAALEPEGGTWRVVSASHRRIPLGEALAPPLEP